jgi:putative NIF3 family GTP cyclohydrolase 1 type 2
VSSEDSALTVTPESTEFNATSVRPQGRQSTVEGEITPQQLDNNDAYTPPNSEITPSKKINSGPISKALYKAKESELPGARHLLKTQNVTIKRLRNNLSSFRRAEKGRQANEKRQGAIRNQTTTEPVTKKRKTDNGLADKRNKKMIFMERAHEVMDKDPAFSKMGKKKQAQAVVEEIYSDKFLGGEVKEAFLHAAKNNYRKNVFPSQLYSTGTYGL